MYLYYITLILAILLHGCASEKKLAVLDDITGYHSVSRGIHIVENGESLYSIAFRYGRDYREIAAINNISNNYKIKPGQKIYLNKGTYNNYKKTTIIKKPVKKQSNVIKSTRQNREKTYNKQNVKSSGWGWPVSGKLVGKFSNGKKLNKGIDIAVNQATNVKASQSGTVVYRGAGLKGYGQLIIIKHSEEFLSAYAHNDWLLVKEGQRVKQGETIAKIGKQANKVLHFEIRRNGKPVDPIRYLSKA